MKESGYSFHSQIFPSGIFNLLMKYWIIGIVNLKPYNILFSLRKTMSPCDQYSDPRRRMLPRSTCSICCSNNSQGFLSVTLWSEEPDTRHGRCWSCHCTWPRHPRCTLRLFVLFHQQMLIWERPSVLLVVKIPAVRNRRVFTRCRSKIMSREKVRIIFILTCSIFETLLPFSMTQNCIKRQGRQSSLFSWLGLA